MGQDGDAIQAAKGGCFVGQKSRRESDGDGD